MNAGQKRHYDRKRYERFLAAGSCKTCGAEALRGLTRCTPCGQSNTRRVRARKLERIREGTWRGRVSEKLRAEAMSVVPSRA